MEDLPLRVVNSVMNERAVRIFICENLGVLSPGYKDKVCNEYI